MWSFMVEGGGVCLGVDFMLGWIMGLYVINVFTNKNTSSEQG